MFALTFLSITFLGYFGLIFPYYFLLSSVMLIYWFLIKDRTQYEILPVKKRFIVGNIMLFYPLVSLAFTALLGIMILPGTIASLISHPKSFFGLFNLQFLGSFKVMFFLFIVGYCLYAAWLSLFIIRSKWLKLTLSAVLTVSIIAAGVLIKHHNPNLSMLNDPISPWINSLTAINYCAVIAALAALWALLFLLCVKLYSNSN